MGQQTLTRRKMLTLMSAPVALAGSGVFTREAYAETFWDFVGDVQIGGVHFSVGLHSPSTGSYGVHSGYYYRTRQRLRYARHRCGSYCYRRGNYDFHHESCPLLEVHVERYGAPPIYYDRRSWGRGDRYRYDGYGSPYRDRGPGRGRRRRGNRGRGRGQGRRKGRRRDRW